MNIQKIFLNIKLPSKKQPILYGCFQNIPDKSKFQNFDKYKVLDINSKYFLVDEDYYESVKNSVCNEDKNTFSYSFIIFEDFESFLKISGIK